MTKMMIVVTACLALGACATMPDPIQQAPTPASTENDRGPALD